MLQSPKEVVLLAKSQNLVFKPSFFNTQTFLKNGYAKSPRMKKKTLVWKILNQVTTN